MSFRAVSSKARRTPHEQQKPFKSSREAQTVDKFNERQRTRYEAADFAEDDDENEDEVDEEEEEESEESEESEEDEDEEDEESEESEESDGTDRTDDDDDENSDAERDKQLKRLMKDLAEVPLGELADIQRKIGMKAFKSATARAKAEQSDEQSDDSEAEAKPRLSSQRSKFREEGEDRKRPIVPKREGKNRPVEMTSKRPVGRYRQVVEVAATKRRDPRFDAMSGNFNADAFSKKYAFLDEYRKSELTELKKSIAKEKDPETKERLMMTLTRIQSQERSKQITESKQAIKREARKKEAELVKMGKTPYFLKKSEQKKLQHISQFQAISKSKNGEKALETFMEKKRKRNATKERRHLPEMMKRRKADE